MRTQQQTLSELLDLAAEQFKVDRAGLAAEDDIFEKLAIDSMQALDLLTKLENHFQVELPDYELAGVRDFASLAERILTRL